MGGRSLRCADDQRSRLAEPTARTASAAKDLLLRRDVRSLGIVLGRVLVEQVSESLLGVVEELRRIFIQHREQPRAHTARSHSEDPLFSQALDIISSPTSEDAHRGAKA